MVLTNWADRLVVVWHGQRVLKEEWGNTGWRTAAWHRPWKEKSILTYIVCYISSSFLAIFFANIFVHWLHSLLPVILLIQMLQSLYEHKSKMLGQFGSSWNQLLALTDDLWDHWKILIFPVLLFDKKIKHKSVRKEWWTIINNKMSPEMPRSNKAKWAVFVVHPDGSHRYKKHSGAHQILGR